MADFGYQSVTPQQKTDKVAAVFDSVANRYDLMNDLMSFGIHRLWKRFAVARAEVHLGYRVLDIAGGTGDLAKRFAAKVGEQGEVILADINGSMLRLGRNRLLDQGYHKNLRYCQANAECLPFQTNYFDRVTIAFGLRNVTHKEHALKSMYRVLKPGGKLIILEFSKPIVPGLNTVYDAYSFKLLPWLGEIIAKDEDSYRYLAESIRMHPDQNTLKQMMLDAGFEDCVYHNLTGGIVAVHSGYKY